MRQNNIIWSLLISLLSCGIISCDQEKAGEAGNPTLFTLLDENHTNIDFINQLEYDEEFNIFTYRNFYNGGGVALGDINNDGLLDIYFTANLLPNKLYLNKGDLRFEDITGNAGVPGSRAWSTGVTMVDINADGLLDIYVCNSGDIKGDNKQNEFFINNGDLTFTEKAEELGLADPGLSTHAAFFDYDKDGDLDVYLLNNSFKAISTFNLQDNERDERDPVGGDKLYRNDDGLFKDVSVEAGIYGSVIGFGLGVTVGDVNRDGWLDIYVSNDFFERDYLYVNLGNGKFREDLENQFRSISAASMGADMADLNNDTYPEIFVTEMLPESDNRQKTVTTFENWDKYQHNLKYDYYHQFTRNMLHLNNTNNTFSEIGRLSGVEATDWSWAALIADFDNDGFKDLFVANGIYQDLTNQDYLNFISSEATVKSVVKDNKVDFKALIDAIPVNPIPNYAFANNRDLTFTNKAEEWGLATPSHSNGSVYGDLDNDGDLDLVVNNVNMDPFIYRNNTDRLAENNYLKLDLEGEGQNIHAYGAKIYAITGSETQYLEQMPTRGFQSSIDPRPHLGLGGYEKVDTLKIEWPGGKVTILTNVEANQILKVLEQQGQPLPDERSGRTSAILKPVQSSIFPYKHIENDFVDFDRERLIYHMVTSEGPKISKGDVNGDGLEDVFIGGAKDSPGKMLIQQRNGTFKRTNEQLFEQNKLSEDTDGLFFDADQDGDLDLYVASGGNEFSSNSSALIDRLYFNDGRGNFTKSEQILPTFQFESSSTVASIDYDNDDDQDLFVGIRIRPFLYGVPVNGYILENDGNGNFRDVTQEIAPGLQQLGLITDALFEDIDGDDDKDLLVVGEWMPISVFINEEGRFRNVTEQWGIAKTHGWWNVIKPGDFDNDGDMDFAVGNHGLNSRFKASIEKPITMYINDFDRNGSVEQIICAYNGAKSYPLALRHDLVMQLPSLKKKYLKYDSYSGQTIEEIFTPQQMENVMVKEVYMLESAILINQGDAFELKPMPIQAQFSATYGIMVSDMDSDGSPDLLIGGNHHRVKPEVGRYDASYGLFLKGNGKGDFESVHSEISGVFLEGEVRDIVELMVNGQENFLIARNNDSLRILTRNK